METVDLAGRVVVVVGDGPALAAVVASAIASGALVAVVSHRRDDVGDGLAFRADPTESGTLARIAAHAEQRLGPIDAVVCDRAAAAAVDDVFGPDLRRRGHGAVVVVGPGDDPAAVVSRLTGTP